MGFRDLITTVLKTFWWKDIISCTRIGMMCELIIPICTSEMRLAGLL